MSYWNDVRDWLGGWPMEFAGIQETKAFCADKLGLEVVNILAGEANTEYVFRPRGCSNYWDDYRSSLNIVNLDRPFISADGHAWVTQLPALAKDADDDAHPRRSSLNFFRRWRAAGMAPRAAAARPSLRRQPLPALERQAVFFDAGRLGPEPQRAPLQLLR